jgi:hypothetical protein
MGKPRDWEKVEKKERMDGRQPTGLGLGVQAKAALAFFTFYTYLS